MVFFLRLYKGLIIVSSYVLFVLFLYFLTSFLYFNHKVDTKIKKVNENVYLKEEIENISFYSNDRLIIEIEFKNEKDTLYLVSYAFYYYDNLNKDIELIDLNLNQIVLIKQNNAYVSKVKNYSSRSALQTSTIFSISSTETYSNRP